MGGSIEGGRKTAATNKARYGEDWYSKIGTKGGKAERTTPRGFAANKELASSAGRLGGLASRRGRSRAGQ